MIRPNARVVETATTLRKRLSQHRQDQPELCARPMSRGSHLRRVCSSRQRPGFNNLPPPTPPTITLACSTTMKASGMKVGRPVRKSVDMGIGRLPVRTPPDQPRSTAQATLVVDKLIAYDSPAPMASGATASPLWPTMATPTSTCCPPPKPSRRLAQLHPAYNAHKVYLDMYPQASGGGATFARLQSRHR